MRLADEGVLDATVDLAELDFIDSSGLQSLMAGLRRLREQGGGLRLRSPRRSTRKVLEITGTSVFRLEAIEQRAELMDASADRAPTMPTVTGEHLPVVID